MPRRGGRLLGAAELELDLVPRQVVQALDVVGDVDRAAACRSARTGRPRALEHRGPEGGEPRSSALRSRSIAAAPGGQPAVGPRGRLRRRGGRGRRPGAAGPPSASAQRDAVAGRGGQGGEWWRAADVAVMVASGRGVRWSGGIFECDARRGRRHNPCGAAIVLSVQSSPCRPVIGSRRPWPPGWWACAGRARRAGLRGDRLVVAALDLSAVVVVVVAAWAGRRARRRRSCCPARVRRRLDEDGYRVRLVRGAGVRAARWRDVEDAVAASPRGSRLRGAAAARRPDHQHPGRGAGRRPRGLRARPAGHLDAARAAAVRTAAGPDSAPPGAVLVACASAVGGGVA